MSTRVHKRPAFSLAELMIAVVILGLGLLFIAAALPVGLEYTRQTVDLTTAEAAGQYALDQLELNLRTSRRLYDWGIQAVPAHVYRRLDNIHRPRYQGVPSPPNPARYPLAPKYEPLFKVRPLVMGNLRMEPVAAGKSREIVDDAEGTITTYLSSGGGMAQTHPLDFDFGFPGNALSLPQNPVLPGLARVYPPIDPVMTFRVLDFFTSTNGAGEPYPSYAPRFTTLNSNPLDELDRERQKALDGRIAWTVFYRRVAYDEPGPDLTFQNPNSAAASDDLLSDPLLYELIIVVTRRPSPNYRFPQQDLTASGFDPFEKPQPCNPSSPPADDFVAALNYGIGTDRLAPMPWLVMFDTTATNPLPLMETFGANLYDLTDSGRPILAGFAEPATLTFRCTTELGQLLPVGSILIPAFNDNFRRMAGGPNDASWQLLTPFRQSGFVPHAPHSLPIYEVIERPDATTVVVKNNGYYPWLNPTVGTLNAASFPVWIIPPAFSQRDSSGQPIYETTSPILKVVRRTVTLRELMR